MSHRSRAAFQRTHVVRSLAVLAYVGATGTAALARAAEQTPVQLTFVGADGCGDRPELEREVARRSEVVRWVAEGGDAVALDVHIWGGVARFDASVVVKRPGALPLTRAITGSTCQEVIEGAALIIAVALSPADLPQPLSPSQRSDQKPAIRGPLTEERLHWSYGGGTTGVALTGIVPALLPGIEVFADASTRDNGWAPAIRVSIRHAARSGFSTGAGDATASFRLISGVAAACPAAWLPNRTLILRPCATGTYGSLQASGSSADTTLTESHPWAAVGGGLRLEARLLEALSVELEGSAEVGLFDGRFWFSGVAFHETSRVSGRLGVGVVARIHE